MADCRPKRAARYVFVVHANTTAKRGDAQPAGDWPDS
jgi:hypothetical protein